METTPTTESVARRGWQGVAIDFALAGGMFLFFFAVVLPPHVPVYDPLWKAAFSAYTATVMAGFFFLFFTLFRATLTDQIAGKELKNARLAKVAKLMRYA